MIGNELLAGRTQDTNLKTIAEALGEIGIRVCEARVVADESSAIVNALNSLRASYDYVFTTGGIGPTHDDITAQCVADAFATPLLQHPEAVSLLRDYYQRRGLEANAARMRMANVPQGGTLIENPVSVAPGFIVGNVIVMAGVPKIMQAMLANVIPQLKQGEVMQSATVVCDLGEGTISAPLEALQHKYGDTLEFGSYPGKEGLSGRLSLVARCTVAETLIEARKDLVAMVSSLGGTVIDNS
jgi:molybdenum cofactor synthesis domain-containing protein